MHRAHTADARADVIFIHNGAPQRWLTVNGELSPCSSGGEDERARQALPLLSAIVKLF